MRVKVLYFGVLKDALAAHHDEVELVDGSAVMDLIERTKRRGAVSADMWGSIAVAVNQEYVCMSALLHDGDEVAFLPPVSGGLGEGSTDAG